MAYKHTNSKGVTYYLNSKEVTLRGGKLQRIYYFSKDERPEASDLPDGFDSQRKPAQRFLDRQAQIICEHSQQKHRVSGVFLFQA